MTRRYTKISNNPNFSAQNPLCKNGSIISSKVTFPFLSAGCENTWNFPRKETANVLKFTWIHALVYCKRSQHKSFISSKTRTTSSQQTDKLGPSNQNTSEDEAQMLPAKSHRDQDVIDLNRIVRILSVPVLQVKLAFARFTRVFYISSYHTATSKHTNIYNDDQTWMSTFCMRVN